MLIKHMSGGSSITGGKRSQLLQAGTLGGGSMQEFIFRKQSEFLQHRKCLLKIRNVVSLSPALCNPLVPPLSHTQAQAHSEGSSRTRLQPGSSRQKHEAAYYSSPLLAPSDLMQSVRPKSPCQVASNLVQMGSLSQVKSNDEEADVFLKEEQLSAEK